MNRAVVLPGFFLAFTPAVQASPPPPLPWVTSSFSVDLQAGRIDFQMDCPAGKLTRMTAKRGDEVATLPIEKLVDVKFVGTCSGVSTNVLTEGEGAGKVVGVELTVKFSQEYFLEDIVITLDVIDFGFSRAMWETSSPGFASEVKHIQLR